jgi:transcriptional regulator of heat shock response
MAKATPETPLPSKLSQRQAKILAAIVKLNCETGQPVASRDLVEKYSFGLSSATIRNEMAALEKLGYIHQPYTSAGRVPTDWGFRYFVNQLMDKVKLTLREQQTLRTEILKLQLVNAEIGRRLAKMLAAHTSQASFAILPEEVSAVGLSNILDNANLLPEDAKEIAQFFDSLDEHADEMIKDYGSHSAKAFIGKELKLSKHSDYSMIVSGLQLPSGKKGVIGLIGPKSMQYQKNLSLMDYIAKLLGTSSAVILVIAYSAQHIKY